MRSIVTLGVLALLSSPALASASETEGHPSLPEAGLVSYLGSCVPQGQDVCAAAFQVWDTADGRHAWIVVERLESQEGAADPRSTLTDQVRYPANGAPVPSVECSRNGRFDAKIIGLARFAPDQEDSSEVSHAWRLDTTTGRLLPLSVAQITCRSEIP